MNDTERLIYAAGLFRGACEAGLAINYKGIEHVMIPRNVAQRIADVLDRRSETEIEARTKQERSP